MRSLAAVLLLLPMVARAEPGLFSSELTGTLGPYRIGLALTLRDDRVFVGAHYFYASHLADIPLTGSMDDGRLELREPGGGLFRFHLTGRAPNARPTSFADALGLAGTWTGGGRTLPVSLDLDWGTPGAWPVRLYASVTDAPDARFEDRVRRFIALLNRDDRRAAAALVSYPLRVSGPRSFTVANPAALLVRWDAVFTPAVRAALAGAIVHDMFVHDGQAMIGAGQVWFNAKGACAVNQA